MINKFFNILRVVYIILVLIIVSSFVYVVLYIGKHPISIENVGLERWSIILTLTCIYGALKLLHPKVLKKDVPMNIIIKSYIIKITARAVVLLSIFYFNLISYLHTGTKNFIYLAFIVIFAFLLCAPIKKQLEETFGENEVNE